MPIVILLYSVLYIRALMGGLGIAEKEIRLTKLVVVSRGLI